MQNYQTTKWSKTYGGARKVLTGTIKGVTSGAYEVDLTTLPDYLNGCVPAGTPVKVDDALRTISIHYAFKTAAVTAYAENATSFDVKLTKSFEGSRVVTGMKLGVVPTTLATLVAEVEDVFTVTAVDRDDSTAYDLVTVSCSARSATQIASGTVLVELAEQTPSSGDYFVKVLPNAILFYDLAKDPNAVYMGAVDALFCQVDGVLLERRVPPISDAVKSYMREQDVYVRYSQSQE